MENYFNKFQKTKDEIENNSNFYDKICSLGKQVSKEQIKKVEAKIGRKIPKSMLDFYESMNGVRITWSYKNPQEPLQLVTGNSKIRNLEEVFDNTVEVWKIDDWEKDYFWANESDENRIKLFKSFMVLDELENENYIVFKLHESQDEPELFLFSYRNQYYPLYISFNEYIDLLLETRGMYFWQEYTTKPETFALNREISDNFYENMALVFPDANLSRMRKIDSPLKISIYNTFMQKENKFDYAKLFADKLDELKKNENIKDISYSPNEPVHIAILRKAKIALGRELPESILAFYTSMNGFQLSWSYEDTNGSEFGGRIYIQALEEVLGGYNGLYRKEWDNEVYKNVLWMEDYDEEDIEFMRTFKIVDKFEGVSMNVVIRFIADKEEPQLFLHNRWDYYKLNVNFSEYIALLLDTLGLQYWQVYLLLPEDFEDINVNVPFYEEIAKVFPNANLSKFRKVD